MELKDTSINEELRIAAANEVIKEGKVTAAQNPLEFVKAVAGKFIEKQLEAFPYYCQVARWQNKLKQEELKETSNQGKYTGTYGWSESGHFKFDYEIPQDLYLFMKNLVYKDFWETENSKVWRKFMKNICRGDDPMETLIKVKMHYGSNSQEKAVVG